MTVMCSSCDHGAVMSVVSFRGDTAFRSASEPCSLRVSCDGLAVTRLAGRPRRSPSEHQRSRRCWVGPARLERRHGAGASLAEFWFWEMRRSVLAELFPLLEFGTQQSDVKRQHLLERLLDAVKQCQIRFGGRKEIATDSDSRVICLCAQFEAVLQHGLRKSKGLALTAAALKQAAGFSSKTEAGTSMLSVQNSYASTTWSEKDDLGVACLGRLELTFWLYVKEHLNRHELQRFYSLRHISSELGRGRAWLRCALNEHSLERYLHTLLADRPRLGLGSQLVHCLNSILFAINIDNSDLNGAVTRGGSTVSSLLKESTHGIGSLLKESTQGVSTLLREISTATAVVPGFTPKVDGASDPLPVLPRSTSAGRKPHQFLMHFENGEATLTWSGLSLGFFILAGDCI
ncbi:Sorting nexin-29 [Goodea atripinnis]|uniref:Sorting nexin-29 n=1 Tax=Goodea atripinnis TaxID=208336 RepID=A0ABV0NWJ0_9TELE